MEGVQQLRIRFALVAYFSTLPRCTHLTFGLHDLALIDRRVIRLLPCIPVQLQVLLELLAGKLLLANHAVYLIILALWTTHFLQIIVRLLSGVLKFATRRSF